MDSERDLRLTQLMRRAQEGDRPAYEALLLEATPLIRAFLARRLRDVGAREDVVQDTLLSIHRHRHTFDPDRAFLPWMYAIARHRLLDAVGRLRRRHAREVLGEDRLAEVAADAPSVDAGLLSTFVRQALAKLSLKQQEVVTLLKLEERSVAEVAIATGMTQTNVKVTAHRGYKRLRLLFSRSGDED